MGGIVRKYIRVFLLLALVVAMSYMPGVQTAKAEPEALAIKIMPFGDSITSSYNPFMSYRCDLALLLRAANIYFIYSGSKIVDSYNNPPPQCGDLPSDFYLSHEGYSGAMAWDFLYNTDPNWPNTIDIILSRNIYNTAKTNIPQIVLMHLGTNDLGQHHPIQQIISDLRSLIDHFRAKNPTVAILVAQIIPCSGYDWCEQVDDLNAAIPALADKSTLLSPVMVVDMYSDYNPLVDNDSQGTYKYYVHPNSSGGAKMAARWMEAIQKYLNRTITQTYIPAVIR